MKGQSFHWLRGPSVSQVWGTGLGKAPSSSPLLSAQQVLGSGGAVGVWFSVRQTCGTCSSNACSFVWLPFFGKRILKHPHSVSGLCLSITFQIAPSFLTGPFIVYPSSLHQTPCPPVPVPCPRSLRLCVTSCNDSKDIG